MLQAFPFQIEAARQCANKDRWGLHDEMGVGKTPAIVLAADMIQAKRGIVICPAILRTHWLSHFRSFSETPYRICKAGDIHDLMSWVRGKFHILICSYEHATKWLKYIHGMGEVLDFVAIDEAHYLKNTGAQRTRAILGERFDGKGGIVEFAAHVWHITGTPMANDPLDIYPFLRMCWSVNDFPQETFTKYFFYSYPTKFGRRQSPRPEMISELQTLIRNNSMRRTKNDVGLQLPPIFLTSMLVDGDTQQIASMLREYPGLAKAIVLAIEQGGLSFLDAQHVATLRRLVGEAKAIPYADMLLEELAGGADKRVVYGIHRNALINIQAYLEYNGIQCVLINGETSEKERELSVIKFQNHPECRVFIGNIRAAGVGITLTAACEIDMVESDWSPAGNAQAIMRVHRIGQLRNVRARFITLANSVDEIVNRVVAAKTAAIAQIEGHTMHAAPLDVLAEFV